MSQKTRASEELPEGLGGAEAWPGGLVVPVPAEAAAAVRLPYGVRDYLPAAAARRRGIAEGLLGEFERWGYRRIITPMFEYEAVLGRGLGRATRAQAVRFVEPTSGEVVALRPDITPQVARLVATRLASEPGPLRLAYEGSVVRLGGSALGGSAEGQRELFQAGVELVDMPAPAGDVEVIALAGAALEAAGLRRYTIDLAEISVVRAALGGIAGAALGPLERAVAKKDVEEVERQARGLDLEPGRRRLLAALPSLYGGPEVLDRAQGLLEEIEDTAALSALAGLAAVVRLLLQMDPAWEARLAIDLGEVRGFDYYTGLRFQGYAPGVGAALVSGGRYDHLIERYGRRRGGAAGFAVDVERVAEALDAHGVPHAARPSGVLVAGDLCVASQLARALRAGGTRVVQELDRGSTDEALRTRAAQAGLAHVLVLEPSGQGGRWLSVENGIEGTIPEPALAAALAAAQTRLDALVTAR
ncbi:MAG TPA: ATP phosphoribosyltransferase regulatory subunit [Polyangia bacterium]|nr:ATP phosphoribosyltransferase regulatory subunit [Polyangia bacterium]